MKVLHRITSIVVLTVIVALSVFLGFNLGYKYGVELKTHPVTSVISRAATAVKKEIASVSLYPGEEQGPSEIFHKENIEYPYSFIVYGDDREPAGDEKDALIEKIIEENPPFVIHTGDAVLRGEKHQWKIFDLFDGEIINSGIPIYPVLGNHEYKTREDLYPADINEPLEHYFKRFEILKNRRWYSFKYGNALFLMLDSMTGYSPGSPQYEWLINELKKEAPEFLFIALHYPLHTRKTSKLRGSEKFLAGLLEDYKNKGLNKADIVFSGHVHNYERYKEKSINYVVSGGGGAPQNTINRGSGDFYSRKGDTYHYCRVRVSEKELLFEMVRLDLNTGEWVVGDSFQIRK